MRGKTVLLVDDNDNDRFLMHRALLARGLKNVVQATTGAEAIDFLGRAEAADDAGLVPSLVLLDLRLPEKDGFDVLRWVRGRARWQTMPVIVLTSSEAPEDIRRAHKLGCNAYIVKPADPADTMFLAGSIREFWLRYHRSLHEDGERADA